MIPNEKVQAIVARHDILEKELSTGEVDPKTFADNSREYSNLGNII
jgi:peptide chain release factor 1